MQITNDCVYALADSIFASGYPMRTKKPSTEEFYRAVAQIEMHMNKGEHDENEHIKRAIRLATTPMNSGHDNFLNGCIVHFDLDAPIKIWTEAQRYHFLDFVSSMSTMHRLKDFQLCSEGVADSYVDHAILMRLDDLQKRYHETGKKEDLLRLLLSAPVGLNLCARMVTNYRQLKTICRQREGHRLPHWKVFIDWVQSLPMAVEFNLTGRDE